MRRHGFPAAALGGLLFLGAPQPASAVSEGEQACCLILTVQALKYFSKHGKLANKCTLKMNDSSDPAGEKCDDGFDAVKNDPNEDFVIDKFKAKFIKKMKKKCAKKLLVAFEVVGDEDAMPECGCPATIKLDAQIDCKLEETASPADLGVCGMTPLRKNSNRGLSSPPAESDFCP